MKIADTDRFEKAPGMLATDIPDGLALNDAEGKDIHFLNPVAGAVFLLCDGAHDARGIAAIIQEQYALDSAPVDDVIGCLAELAASGVITRL